MKVLEANKKFVIVAYDITDNRRRNRIFKDLKGMGFHVQKSVFECLLTDIQIGRLKKLLLRKIDPDKDAVRIYALPAELKDQVVIIGLGETIEDQPIIVV